MEKSYRVQNLVLERIPFLIKLFGYSFDWSKEDRNFEKKLAVRQRYMERHKTAEMQINTSLYDLLIEAEMGNESASKFISFINRLLTEVVGSLPQFEAKIKKKMVKGKINALDNWNYLNPIGELACLKKLLDSQKYTLKEIECDFENGKKKDFLLTDIGSQADIMVEILNIHSRFREDIDFQSIKSHLFDKVISKVNSETAGADPEKYDKALFFIPVVRHIGKESMEKNYNFFKQFKDTLGGELDLKYAICGFCSHLIINGIFEFGEISSLIDRIRQWSSPKR